MDTTAIRIQRALRDITATELARRAGVSRHTAWRWEHNRPYVSTETAAKLERALFEGNGTGDAPRQR